MFNCNEVLGMCQRAMEPHEQQDAYEAVHDWIMKAIDEERYGELKNLLFGMWEVRDRIDNGTLMGAISYSAVVADKIEGWNVVKGRIMKHFSMRDSDIELEESSWKNPIKDTPPIFTISGEVPYGTINMVSPPVARLISEWVTIYKDVLVHFEKFNVIEGSIGYVQLDATLDEDHKASVRDDQWPEELGEWSIPKATKKLLLELFPPLPPLSTAERVLPGLLSPGEISK